MEYLTVILLFIPFFIGMWFFVTFLVSRAGWSALAARFRTNSAFEGESLGVISAMVNIANYRHTLVLKYNEAGIHLQPVKVFRMFHPPLLIPWKEIKEVREKEFLFYRYNELVIGEPRVATIRVKTSTFSRIDRNSARK